MFGIKRKKIVKSVHSYIDNMVNNLEAVSATFETSGLPPKIVIHFLNNYKVNTETGDKRLDAHNLVFNTNLDNLGLSCQELALQNSLSVIPKNLIIEGLIKIKDNYK